MKSAHKPSRLDPAFRAALAAHGGTVGLAKHLGTTPQTVSNWRTRGVPHGWLTYLKAVHKTSRA